MVAENKTKVALMQFFWMLTPVVLMIFCGLIGYAAAQMNEKVNTKADKTSFAALCDKVDAKAENATIIQMLETLKQKDQYLERENDLQDNRINFNREIMVKQLEVQKSTEKIMIGIKKELEELNK